MFNSRWPRGKVGKRGEQMVASGVSHRKGKDDAPKKEGNEIREAPGVAGGDVVFGDAPWS